MNVRLFIFAAALSLAAGCDRPSGRISDKAIQGQPLSMLGSSGGGGEVVVAPEIIRPDQIVNPLLTPEADEARAIADREAMWDRYASRAEAFGSRGAELSFAFASLERKPADKRQPFEIELQAGVELLNAGKIAEAAQRFEAAQLLNPQDYRGFFFESVCRIQLDELARAAAALDFAINRAPDEIELYLHRGNLRMRNRDYVAATNDFTRVLQKYPDNLPALINRASANFYRRRPRDMIVDTTTVIEIRQDIPDAYLLRALGNIMTGEPARARRDFDSAVAAGLSKEATESWRSLFYGRDK